MAIKLSERDQRAIALGAIAVVAILAYYFGGRWLGEWQTTRAQLRALRAQLAKVEEWTSGRPSARQLAVAAAVPTFAMPEPEDQQAVLFRNAFNEQLNRAGIKAKSLDYQASRKAVSGSYKTLRLQCKARCQLAQVLDLLARLPENKYFVGVEELQIRPDSRNRQEVDIVLTLSTFARLPGAKAGVGL